MAEILRFQIGRDCTAEIVLTGTPTQEAIARLIAHLTLMRDCYPGSEVRGEPEAERYLAQVGGPPQPQPKARAVCAVCLQGPENDVDVYLQEFQNHPPAFFCEGHHPSPESASMEKRRRAARLANQQEVSNGENSGV